MKKTITFFIFILLLSACGSANYNVELITVPVFKQDHSPSNVSFQITEGEKPIEGLEVVASFEMEKMDHGVIEISLEDSGEGLYTGEVTLPMGGAWQALLIISNGKTSEEKLVEFTVEEAVATTTELAKGIVATVNGEEITDEDIAFYELINKLQIEMYREADTKKYKGEQLEKAMNYWDAQIEAAQNKNTLLTQIIRLRAMALLAKEKGYSASEEEIAKKIAETKIMYSNSPIAQQLIKAYGEEKFWSIQKKQHQSIVLVSKVQQDVLNKVKEANPQAEAKEINMLAEKKYEDLLVSQVGTLDIKINQS